MASLLERLIGQQLLRFNQSKDGLSIEFSAARVVVFNPVSTGNLREYVGSKVQALRYLETEYCLFAFSNGKTLSVSLLDKDFSGPEAFCVTFTDGVVVVAP